jgi:hypothetical protein
MAMAYTRTDTAGIVGLNRDTRVKTFQGTYHC